MLGGWNGWLAFVFPHVSVALVIVEYTTRLIGGMKPFSSSALSRSPVLVACLRPSSVSFLSVSVFPYTYCPWRTIMNVCEVFAPLESFPSQFRFQSMLSSISFWYVLRAKAVVQLPRAKTDVPVMEARESDLAKCLIRCIEEGGTLAS